MAFITPMRVFRMPSPEKAFETAGIVCDPINLLDACRLAMELQRFATSDPARLKHRRVKVVASSAATDTLSKQHRKQPTWICAAEASSKAAYSQTGFTPNSIDFFEYHDAFSIMAALSLEASGFCSPGEGPKLANDGSITLTCRIPVATMGGLKARGHPVGATGAYQLVEVTQQLRELAGINQVEGAKVGMAQNIGGSGSNVITHILSLE